MHLRHRASRIGEDAHGPFCFRRDRSSNTSLDCMRKDRPRCFGYPLLQQQTGRFERGVSLKAALHRLIEQKVRQRQEAHPFMVCHKRPDRRAADSERQARRGVVYCFIKTVAALASFRRKPLEISACGLGRHHQSHDRGIRRNNDVFGQSSLQSKPRYAKGPILVVQVHIPCVEPDSEIPQGTPRASHSRICRRTTAL